MKAWRAMLLGAALVTVTAAGAEAPGIVVQDAALRAQPSTGAETVARLDRGDAVALGQRAGGWIAVRTRVGAQRAGWMRVWHVRRQHAADTEEGNPLLAGLKRFSRAVTGLFERGGGEPDTGNGQTVATFGVRGLDGGDIASAAPNAEGLERLAAARASPTDAKSYAHAEHLQRRAATVPGAGVSGAENWSGW